MKKSILTTEALGAMIEVLREAYNDYKSGFDTEGEWNAMVWAYQALCTNEEWKKVYGAVKEMENNL